MPFTLDPERNIGFLLHDVSRMLRARFDARAQALGLTRAQWRVLVHVAPRQGIRQKQLAEILELDTVTLCRHIDRLEGAGWLERRSDPDDRRAWQLFLTDKARPTLDRMEELAVATQDEALQNLRQADREHLVRLLISVKDAMTGLDDSVAEAPGEGEGEDAGEAASRPARRSAHG